MSNTNTKLLHVSKVRPSKHCLCTLHIIMHSALYYVNFGCIALSWVASLDGPSCPSGIHSLNVLPIVIAVYLFVKNKLSLSLSL